MKSMAWTLAAAAIMGMLMTTPAAATSGAFCGHRADFLKGPRLVVLGLTADQRLVRFKECTPWIVRTVGYVHGLQAPDTTLVGMDFRVQDGKLYGAGNGGGIYTLDTSTAAATLVSQLTGGATLQGAFFGVDFNPAADRLRIVSTTGQNLRHNVNAGGTTTVDQLLNYPPAAPLCQQDPVTSVIQCQQGPTALGISGAAYTNNDLSATTGTTLFDIDTLLNQVVIQSPPNNGSLVAAGQLTVDPDTAVGFDIYTRLRDNVAVDNYGFASLVVGGSYGFYRVNFLTGQAIRIGTFYDQIIDIALPLN